MKKRILSALLCCVMLLGLLPATAFAAGTGKAIQLGVGSITGYADTKSYDYIYFGSWDDQSDTTTSAPIKWRVLDDQTNTNKDGLFLLSEVLLEEKILFHDSSNAWNGSNAQKWCQDFAGEEGAESNVTDAFTKDELNAILPTTTDVLNGDKVFFLSEGEAKLAAYGLDNQDARVAYYGTDARTWWLRTPINMGDGPAVFCVLFIGWIQGIHLPQSHAARPAFNLDSSAILLTSAAEGGKSADGMDDTLTTVEDYNGSEWKLTLKDSRREGFSAEQTSIDGSTLTVSYSGAVTGENEYISAIVLNNDTVRYYGRIANVSAADGEVSFTLPDGFSVADSDHLYIFNEQYNGDKQTDYASDLVEMDVSIHKHAWSEDWITNRSYHWRECIAIGDCDITSNTQKGEYGKHDFDDDGICKTCGYERPLPLHTHYLCGDTESCTAAGHTETAHTIFSKQIAKDEYGNLLLDGELWNTEDGAPGDSNVIKYYTLHGDDPDGPTTYYLDCDYEGGVPWLIRGNVILCLNGHTISKRGGGWATIFLSQAGANFTLCDCQGTGTITHAKLNTGAKPEGPGVMVRGNSTFNMYGGNISGNTYESMIGSIRGSGVAVYGGSTFNMYGGSITGNNNGGVRISYNSTFTVSGAAQITNNWENGTVNEDGTFDQGNGKAQNVWLEHTATLTVKDLTEGAKIGITSEFGENGLYPYVFSNACDTNYSDYFFADDPNAHVEYNGDKKLQLAAGAPSAHTHNWSDDWSSDGTHHWHECTAEGCDITDNAQKDGYAAHYGEDDGNCTTAVNCEACGYEITAAQSDHSYPDTWTAVRPGTSHRRSCQNEGCGMTKTGNCVSDGKATCQEFAKCTVCGGDCGTKADHSFTAENTDAQYLKSAATCTERALYYKSCAVCGLSSEGMADEDTFESGDIDAGNHTGNIGDWQTDSEKHWKEYSCCHAKAEEAAHDYDNDADPICDICGYTRSEVSFHSITVVGNGKDRGNWLNGANWDPADASNHMTETADAVYEITYTGIAASGDTNYEVKFAADDGWTDNWGAEDSTSLSGNAVYNAPGISFSVAKDNSTVKIVLDLSNYDYTTKQGATYAITITQSHTHTWSATWTYDETHHWHECTADSCDITENAAKDSYGAHIFDNDADPICNTCGYIRTLTHTITFDANGGTVVGSTTAQTNTDGKLSSLPTATHFGSYFFDGWYTQRKGGTKITTDTVFSKDTTVYAHWTYINLNIGGSGSRYDYCTIRATAGDNGSLSPVGNVSVREGKDQIFTITPDTGYVVSDVLVDGRSIGAVTSYTFTNVRSDHTIEALFEKEESDIPQTLPFVDVAEDAYYYDAILWAVENGITSGTDDVHFTPDAPCTRAQIVTFLWRAAGEPVVNYAMQMDDVAEDAYYAEAVRWALSCGITTGATETTFRPDDECTRAQAVVFLFRYAAICGMDAVTLQELVSGYADANSVPDYALPAMNWALAAGIVQGDGTNLMPNAGCTRGQIVTFLWRTLVK